MSTDADAASAAIFQKKYIVVGTPYGFSGREVMVLSDPFDDKETADLTAEALRAQGHRAWSERTLDFRSFADWMAP